jgi:hypothetical protein
MSKQKKILIVSASFYPELSPRSFRATELAKEFSRQGHLVTVYTHRNENVHHAYEKKWNISINDLGKLRLKKINYNHPIRCISLVKRGIRRILLLLLEYPDIELMYKANKVLKKENGYDLLISIAVPFPIHWGVAKAFSKNKQLAKTWVADCGDPYMGDESDSFKKLFYFKYLEKFFCRTASYVSVPTNGSIKGYYPEFHSKIKVIPQAFNFEDISIYKGEIKNEIPTFAYAGSFNVGVRDPRELLDFLCAYSKPYKFVVYTSQGDLINRYVELSNSRVEVRNYIPREQLLFELSKMDFLINLPYGTSLQTSSKLIDYALTKRPVLSVVTGNLDKKSLQEFLVGNYERKMILDNIQQYNIKNVTKDFLNLITERAEATRK